MPIYEYECGVCQFRFERKQHFDEEPVAMCPECQGKARRIIHSRPIIFRGSGFYITDSRKSTDPEKSTEPEKGKKELPSKEKRKGEQ